MLNIQHSKTYHAHDIPQQSNYLWFWCCPWRGLDIVDKSIVPFYLAFAIRLISISHTGVRLVSKCLLQTNASLSMFPVSYHTTGLRHKVTPTTLNISCYMMMISFNDTFSVKTSLTQLCRGNAQISSRLPYQFATMIPQLCRIDIALRYVKSCLGLLYERWLPVALFSNMV